MHREAMERVLLPYGLGVLLLGIVGVVVGDFALQWQPVAAGVPMRTVLAYASALLLLLGGACLFVGSITSRAALFLGSFFAVWAAALHLPRVLPHLSEIGAWNGLAEITAAACGGFAAWVLSSAPELHPVARTAIPRVLGACLLVFGSAHFAYAEFTASMVPAWIPGSSLFWALATGTGHLAAGLSLVSGILSRLAATLLTSMFASFVLLLHAPRVIADPGVHMEWVMLAISTTLTGAAWVVRGLTPEHTPRLLTAVRDLRERCDR
jgi:uncharacterized membrane protein YphA (DoxX/SURF4 family)